MNSSTYWNVISFEGEIGIEASDFVNCIPERGRNWIMNSLFCSIPYQIHKYYVNSIDSYFRLSWVRYNSRIWYVIGTIYIIMRLARATHNKLFYIQTIFRLLPFLYSKIAPERRKARYRRPVFRPSVHPSVRQQLRLYISPGLYFTV